MKMMNIIIKNILFLLFLAISIAQTEFQISSIAENSFALANHKGLSAIQTVNKKSDDNINLSTIFFPSSINYLHTKYKKYSFSILDYGEIKNQIHNDIIDVFNAYEIELKYHYKKNIINKFLINFNSGFIYSQISNYNSSALVTDIKISFNEKYPMAISFNNLGIIINSYTAQTQKLPLEFQFGIAKYFNNSNIIVGYDVLYRNNIKDLEHILCFNMPVKKNIHLKLSWSSFRKNLITDTIMTNWMYGLGGGIGLHTKKLLADIGISSLGPAGLVYGISFTYLAN